MITINLEDKHAEDILKSGKAAMFFRPESFSDAQIALFHELMRALEKRDNPTQSLTSGE